MDLFDKQSTVGARIEKILSEREITKTEICNSTGISKPTLDKLLKGTLTNRINYNKHIEKLLFFLDIDESSIFVIDKEIDNQIRSLRNILGKTQEEVANAIGISVKRYVQIEEGEEASLAELRDIAAVLCTSVNDLLGKNYFVTQVAYPDLFIANKSTRRIGGFWGHVGILMINRKEYVWYPITANVRENAYDMMDKQWMIIPCMNNKLLVINTSNIKEIIFSDFGADQPDFINWDSSVDCGDMPLVFYEAFFDYYDNAYDDSTMSKKFEMYLEGVIKEEKIDIERFANELSLSNIYYSDGESKPAHIDFLINDDLVFAITSMYEHQDYASISKFIPYEDFGGTEMLLNTKNVSMIEVPLVMVEEAIDRMYEEIRG